MIAINANHDAKQAACQCLSNPAGVSITVVATACLECKSCKEFSYFLQLGKKIKLCAIAFEDPRGWATVTSCISWNEQRRCDCLQQGNGLKTARQGKKKIHESMWTCADAFLLIPKKTVTSSERHWVLFLRVCSSQRVGKGLRKMQYVPCSIDIVICPLTLQKTTNSI